MGNYFPRFAEGTNSLSRFDAIFCVDLLVQLIEPAELLGKIISAAHYGRGRNFKSAGLVAFEASLDARSKFGQTEKRNGQRLDPLTVTDRPTFVAKGWWLPNSVLCSMPLANIMHVDCFNRRVMTHNAQSLGEMLRG